MKRSKTKSIIGWILTSLVGLFLLGVSGLPKFSFVDWPGKQEMMEPMMEHLGISMNLLPTLGVIEVAIAILCLLPRTAFLGTILATGLLGGAVFTHLRVGDSLFETLFSVILGVMLWTGLALRDPILFSLACGNWRANCDAEQIHEEI